MRTRSDGQGPVLWHMLLLFSVLTKCVRQGEEEVLKQVDFGAGK